MELFFVGLVAGMGVGFILGAVLLACLAVGSDRREEQERQRVREILLARERELRPIHPGKLSRVPMGDRPGP